MNAIPSIIASTAAIVLAFDGLASAAITAGLGEPTGTIRTDSYPGAGFGFFAPTSGTTINRLGFWDQGGDGLVSSHNIGLYRYNGSGYDNIALVTIPAGSSALLENGYRWVDIPELFLDNNGQNADYYLLLATQGSDPWTDGLFDATPMDPSIGTTASRALIVDTSTLEAPALEIDGSSSAITAGYGGANLGIAVPEPSSNMVIASVSLCLILQRRRKSLH